jgi:hypothetical protein
MLHLIISQGIHVTGSITDGDFCLHVTEIAQNILRLSKPSDMTIHWKALPDGTINYSIRPVFCIFLKNCP